MAADITGIILAGGKSSRIGQDKAFLKIGEKALIEIVLEKLKTIFKDICIVANNFQDYKPFGATVLSDIILEKGPLGGIYTGLVHSKTFYNFFVACDMPFINENLIRYMIENINSYDAIFPFFNARPQPLFAIYSKNCIASIEEELKKEKLKITNFYSRINAGIIGEEEIKKIDPDGLSFVNINTLEEYNRISGYQGISK